ncbi:hypothetical protein OOK27_47580 [Streptomyces canus]|uniref:hypothetical protein n=1 Tax=Streptomyces canus TaxID=58343 RepID=UPI0022568583|nr:hypothetical protein [Streptomyces canus]MCX5261712.1 hypothetical protein [Streptomyces canus]
MTTVAPVIAQLVADPSLISLVYQHEHPLQVYEFEDTPSNYASSRHSAPPKPPTSALAADSR